MDVRAHYHREGISSSSGIGPRGSNSTARSSVSISTAGSAVSISEIGTTVSISRICGPGASASNSRTRGFASASRSRTRGYASASTIGNESSMGFGPSFQLGFLANGKIGDDAAVLSTGNMSLSNLDPRLWVLLRWRTCAIFVETNVTIGPREGRHAGDDNYFPLLVHLFVLYNGGGHLLTTDDRSVDLDIRPEKRSVDSIVVKGVCKEEHQAYSGHDRYTRLVFFISKKRRFALQD